MDYSDSYAPFNSLSTYGAIVSTVASVLYLATVLNYDMMSSVTYGLVNDALTDNHTSSKTANGINEQNLDALVPNASSYHAFEDLATS